METYNGHVRTPTDAIILFEACRLGILPRVQRRLSEKERQSIRSGSVFVWDEREAGMRRWTDGKSWSASRVSGSFLTYREMEGKRGGNSFVQPTNRGTKTPDSGNDDPLGGDGEEGPDGYRYKPDGLMKQSFSITTSQGQHLHLISYYSRSHPTAQVLRQPSTDPNLASIQPAKGMYPESTINDQSTVPAVTRSPMVGAPGYVMSPGAPGYHRPSIGAAHPHTYFPPGYIPHYIYPISPMHTPPGHYALQHFPGLPPGLPTLGYQPYPAHPLALSHPPPPVGYDTRPSLSVPPRASVPPPASLGHPPPPSTPYAASVPPPHTSYQTAPPPTPTEPQKKEDVPEQRLGPVQIDPRLHPGIEPQPNGGGLPRTPTESHPDTRPPEYPGSAASQAPTINALVHGITTTAAATAAATSVAAAAAATATVERSSADLDAGRDGSESPGGTKASAPPQDIPSEKLGFREDKRALSKLDRVFARV